MSGFENLLGDVLTYTFFGFYEAVKIVAGFDVVHSQYGSASDVMLGAKLASKQRKRFAVTVHGKFGREYEDIPPNEKALTTLREARSLIVNRRSTYEFLRERGFTNVSLIRNPIPVAAFARPTCTTEQSRNAIRALFVGRLNYRRGPHLALQGFLLAAKQIPDIELWVVGDGPLCSSLKSYVRDSGLGRRVVFFGRQLNVKHFLWNSDIFLATSPIANSPSLALREAMAAGLSVVATDVEETRDVITDYKTGLLVPPTSQGVADALLTLSSDRGLRLRLANLASQYARKTFDVQVYIRKLLNAYSYCDEDAPS